MRDAFLALISLAFIIPSLCYGPPTQNANPDVTILTYSTDAKDYGSINNLVSTSAPETLALTPSSEAPSSGARYWWQNVASPFLNGGSSSVSSLPQAVPSVSTFEVNIPADSGTTGIKLSAAANYADNPFLNGEISKKTQIFTSSPVELSSTVSPTLTVAEYSKPTIAEYPQPIIEPLSSNSIAPSAGPAPSYPEAKPTQYPEVKPTPYPGCAAALKCVPENYCNALGVASDTPVDLTRDFLFSRVALTDCLDEPTGIIGKCCRDPDYKDPWPADLPHDHSHGHEHSHEHEHTELNVIPVDAVAKPSSGLHVIPISTYNPSTEAPKPIGDYGAQPGLISVPGDNYVTSPPYSPPQQPSQPPTTVSIPSYYPQRPGYQPPVISQQPLQPPYATGNVPQNPAGYPIPPQASSPPPPIYVPSRPTYRPPPPPPPPSPPPTYHPPPPPPPSYRPPPPSYRPPPYHPPPPPPHRPPPPPPAYHPPPPPSSPPPTHYPPPPPPPPPPSSSPPPTYYPPPPPPPPSPTYYPSSPPPPASSSYIPPPISSPETPISPPYQPSHPPQSSHPLIPAPPPQSSIPSYPSSPPPSPPPSQPTYPTSSPPLTFPPQYPQQPQQPPQYPQQPEQPPQYPQQPEQPPQYPQQPSYPQRPPNYPQQLQYPQQGYYYPQRPSKPYIADEVVQVTPVPKFSTGVCGLKKNDGTVYGNAPWHVIVYSSKNKDLICAGVIIAENAVLTAAHCLDHSEAESTEVKIGPQGKVYKAAAIARHSQYEPISFSRDLALVFLQELIQFDEYVEKICLPTSINQQQSNERECYASSMNKDFESSTLEIIPVEVFTYKDCEVKLRNTYLGKYFVLNNSFSCVSTPSDNELCSVKTGAPIACNKGDGSYELFGIKSWDLGCQQYKSSAIFSNTDVIWIQNTLSTPIPQLIADEKARRKDKFKGESLEGININEKPAFALGYGK